MASRTIITGFARALSVNLTAPYAHQATDTPKYGVQLAYPKNQMVMINGQHMANTDPNDIFAALEEVTQEQFQQPFAAYQNPAMGVQYPPALADGDQKLAKDQLGNAIPNQIDPTYAGMWLISAKNVDVVGCAGADAKPIAASAIYRGCWVKAELEVQAFQTKAGNKVISLRLMNVMKCYDDERIGGGAVQQSASSAFANHTVANTNIAVGSDQVMTPMPTIGHAQGAVVQPNPVVAPPVAAAPIAPTAPVAAPAPIAPVAAAPTAPIAPVAAAPTAPVAPVAVIMNAGLDYAAHIAIGHTDETLIRDGLAVPNYTV